MRLPMQSSTKKSLINLYFYPVKSCKGIQTHMIQVTKKGPAMDRRWMIVNKEGHFITQRNYPSLALIETEIEDSILTMQIPGYCKITVPVSLKGPKCLVKVWRDTCEAIDQGDAIAEQLSQFLGFDCRLVFMPDFTFRQVDQIYSTNPQDDIGFADGFPFLLISSASLEDLNSRLDHSPLLMNRFRPNLVISHCEPYEEDAWKLIRIGQIVFHVAKPCSRCVVTTINQESGEKGLEPLQTLATYRKKEKGIMFGQNLIHQNEGTLFVGDTLEVLEYR